MIINGRFLITAKCAASVIRLDGVMVKIFYMFQLKKNQSVFDVLFWCNWTFFLDVHCAVCRLSVHCTTISTHYIRTTIFACNDLYYFNEAYEIVKFSHTLI